MSGPLVSICLPNRNTRPYLPERIATILGQTYANWELIISDNFSDDGAWELLAALAAKDNRVRASQVGLGMYDGWNDCIRRAQGDYIYIATSDDTMAPECLEKMVAALERHPECDIAHCKLQVIDSQGREFDHGWSNTGLFALSSGRLIGFPHVRVAPFDALLLMSGRAVYWSMTQLLIRRKLFAKVGFFESRWGSVGDMNWQMRACLVANTFHVADTWAGWRVHPDQATAAIDYCSSEYERKIQEMINHAISETKRAASSGSFAQYLTKWSRSARSLRQFQSQLNRKSLKREQWLFILRELARGKFGALLHLHARLAKQPDWPVAARKWALEGGVTQTLRPP